MTDTSKKAVERAAQAIADVLGGVVADDQDVSDLLRALATKLAEAERRERALLDNSERCRVLQRQSNVFKARIEQLENKLAEVTADRDDLHATLSDDNRALSGMRERAEAAEAALATARRVALEEAAEMVESFWLGRTSGKTASAIRALIDTEENER